MLARVIDPAQRVSATFDTLELCRDALEVEPDTVLATVNDRDITAELLAPALASYLDIYNHSHLAHRNTPWDKAQSILDDLTTAAALEVLAEQKGLILPEVDAALYPDGYQGYTSRSQVWEAEHEALWTALAALYPTREELEAALSETGVSARWLTPERLHTLIGTAVYFSSLLILYRAVSLICLGKPSAFSRPPFVRSCLSPVFWYFFIVLGLPALNSSYAESRGRFSEYAALISAACLILLLLYGTIHLLIIFPQKIKRTFGFDGIIKSRYRKKRNH